MVGALTDWADGYYARKLGLVSNFGKLMDALMDCVREGENCNIAFGDTPEQRSLGRWSDGTAVREMEVFEPENGE